MKAASVLTIVLAGALALPAYAQEAESGDGGGVELATQLSNPVASMISVPFQNNTDFGIGPDDGWRNTLNIQPVIPISISSGWNLIARTIVPVVTQEDVDPANRHQFGLGDTTQTFFFSPKTGGGLVWGVGPALVYPTGTDGLSAGKWGAGPSIVLVKQTPDHTTFGLLANHIWSYAGADSHPEVSATFIQPFIGHTFASTLGISANLETSYAWETDQWTVPVNLSVSRIFRIGGRPVSFAIGGRYYLDGPSGGPEWGLRLVATLIIPEG